MFLSSKHNIDMADNKGKVRYTKISKRVELRLKVPYHINFNIKSTLRLVSSGRSCIPSSHSKYIKCSRKII